MQAYTHQRQVAFQTGGILMVLLVAKASRRHSVLGVLFKLDQGCSNIQVRGQGIGIVAK